MTSIDERQAKAMERFAERQKLNTNKEVSRVESFTIPDGEYYVGCPRLALPEDKWEWWCKQKAQCFEMDGHKVIKINTGGDGYWRLYDMNWNEMHSDDDGNLIEGPVHIDSLPTDVAAMSLIPVKLLESLGCDMDEVAEWGYFFETIDDEVFEVEFKYKVYEGHTSEWLSHVDFLWFKLNVACQYMEESLLPE